MNAKHELTVGKTFEKNIEDALGRFAVSDGNPCGGTGYYEPEESLPYRVLFCDGSECESFATPEEAIASAQSYADEMRAEN